MYPNLSRGELLPLLKNYKVVRTVLDYLTIYEFKRDRPPPRELAVVDSFDDYKCDDYIDIDYTDF
jgi:uncharacterized protein (DUF608 family)